jgi:hypothetical protein
LCERRDFHGCFDFNIQVWFKLPRQSKSTLAHLNYPIFQFQQLFHRV